MSEQPPQAYHVHTFGCQMNTHDSERISGMLDGLGMTAAASSDEADVVVFNTCTIREKPDQKLFNLLEHEKYAKQRNPGRIVAVGGCLVEAQRDMLFEQFPFLDVAFGPGLIHNLGDHLAARSGAGAQVGVLPGREQGEGFFGIGDERRFASELPTARDRAHQAWVQISMGCNMQCSYCIVPAVRGKEISRPQGDIVEEVRRLAADGVREVTLLGQNVNSWGTSLRTRDAKPTFAELLRAVDAIDGIERIRYTSPHPAHMGQDVIDAMAGCAAVCEQLHLPLQAGSSRVLKAMKRTYTRERYLDLVGRIRAGIPGIALSTDIIVGFPGETEAEFLETVEVCEQVRFDGAYTFIFSPRTGTPAADLPDLPHAEKQRRLEHLIGVVRRIATERNEQLVGQELEVLVEGAARKRSEGSTRERLRGRTRTNVTVNFTVPDELPGGTALDVAPAGSLVPVRITRASSETFLGTLVEGAVPR